MEPDPQYPLLTQIFMCCCKSNELGHWIHGDGLVDPGHGYTNIHYEFVVIRTYAPNEGGQLDPVPQYPLGTIFICCHKNIGLVNGRQLQADRDPHDHEGSYKYSPQVSFFEEHVHHVPMEWTT